MRKIIMIIKHVIALATVCLTGCMSTYESVGHNTDKYKGTYEVTNQGSELKFSESIVIRPGGYVLDYQVKAITNKPSFKFIGNGTELTFHTLGMGSIYSANGEAKRVGAAKIEGKEYEVFEVNQKYNRLIAYDIVNNKLFPKSLMKNGTSFLEGVGVTSEGDFKIVAYNQTSTKGGRNYIRYLGESNYNYRFEFSNSRDGIINRSEYPSSQKTIKVGEYIFKVSPLDGDSLKFERLAR
jgi:hypothetical protein|tara:strand:+ start:8429 stop:9142 length:714 start_codon:yes stop_codon:yes gene_type:complete